MGWLQVPKTNIDMQTNSKMPTRKPTKEENNMQADVDTPPYYSLCCAGTHVFLWCTFNSGRRISEGWSLRSVTTVSLH
jgi:hypothetical protein